MRKSIFFSLLCLIAIVAVACGGGDNTKGNGSGGGNAAACGGDNGGGDTADAWATYRKEGRNWTHEMTGGMTMKTTIKNVTDDSADMETQMYGADGEPMGDANVTPMKFETADATDAAGDPVEPEKKSVESKAGTFDCVSYDGGSTWMMEKYPGIIVKSDSMELIEFNE